MPGNTANKRSRFQIEKDRKEIARRYLQGETQAAIGYDLGMTQQMVSYDLAQIRKQWRAAAIRDFDDLVAQELARIDYLEVTYWEAWVRSCGEVKTRTQYVKPNREGAPEPERGVIRTEDGLGDPRFLAGVQWCIDRRCKLLGLDAASKVDLTTRGESLNESRIPADQHARTIVGLLAALAEDGGTSDPGAEGDVGATEQASVAGVAESSG